MTENFNCVFLERIKVEVIWFLHRTLRLPPLSTTYKMTSVPGNLVAPLDSCGGGHIYMALTCAVTILVNSLNVSLMAGYLSVRTAGDASDTR